MRVYRVGTVIWETFVDGDSYNEVGYDLCETPEEGYLVAGTLNTGASITDLWMVCFDSCTGAAGGAPAPPGLGLETPCPTASTS